MAALTLAVALAVAPIAASPKRAGVGAWRPLIDDAARRFALPAGWIARVMRVESGGATMLGGRPIRSPAGAIGLMQLMPGTWRDMQQAYGLGADPDDPASNIAAGAAYLRLLYDRFGYPGLFAAYNAGPERYAAYLAGQVPLPRETRMYLADITGATPNAPLMTPASHPGRPLFAVRHEIATPPEPSGPAAQSSTLFALVAQQP